MMITMTPMMEMMMMMTMMGLSATAMLHQNHSIHGYNHSMHGHNHSMHGNNHSMHRNNHSMHGNNHSMHGNNHSMHGNNHSMHGNNHSMHGNNHSMHCNNNSMHGNHGNHGNHGSHSGHGNSHAGMAMWFTVGNDLTLLFKEWKVDSVGDLVGAMIFLFVLGTLYEGLKTGREVLKRKAASPTIRGETYDLSGGKCQKVPPAERIAYSTRRMLFSKLHLLQTFLHMLQVFIGYILMLAFMTYNVWLCLAVILGAGSGYFLFGWKVNSLIDIGDHCF